MSKPPYAGAKGLKTAKATGGSSGFSHNLPDGS